MPYSRRFIALLLGCLCSLPLHAGPFPALVDGAWLSANQAGVVVMDVRSRAEFVSGHWPGARWAGFKALGWQVDRYGLPGYLPDAKRLSILLGDLGLRGSESVIVVGSAETPKRIAEAARVVWSLMVSGFRRVALLDGGVESLPGRASIGAEGVVRRTKCLIRYRRDLSADTNRVEDLLENNGTVVDFRPTPYFEGVKRDPRIPKPGTILDARGFPPERLVARDGGRFLPAEEIRREFAGYGIPDRGAIVTFSGTGVWGALGWFVLHRILDNAQARLYDGSLVEWVDWGGEVHDSTDDMGGPIG